MKKIIGWTVAGLVLVGLAGWVLSKLFEDPHVVQGRAVYVKYCSSCHGVKGRGDGFNAAYVDPRPRDLTDSVEPYMVEASNEEMFSAIRSGTAGVAPSMEAHLHDHDHDSSSEEEGFGSPAMPYWGFTLSDQEIWSIVAFIRTLHKNDAPPVEFSDKINAQRVRPTVAAQIEIPSLDSSEGQKLASQGKTLFEDRYACTSCHGLDGKGGKVGPALDRAGIRMNPDWVYRWIQDPKGIKKNATMPAFALPDKEARAITLYLMTLQAPAPAL